MASLILKGFKALKDAFSPSKFEARLKREVKVATAKNALLAEAAIKEGITSGAGGSSWANSPMTEAIKGSSRPLVDTGELLKSIIGRATDWDTAVVGVLKSRRVTDAGGYTRELLSVATILHNGATINVTDAMRGYFFHKADQYRKGEIKEAWKPLKASTVVIVIPPRPFLTFAVTAKMMQRYQDNWADAVQRAIWSKR